MEENYPAPGYDRFLLRDGILKFKVDFRDEISYRHRVNEPLLTTRGSDADVQGDSLKGVRAGSGGCYGVEVPASLLFCLNTEKQRRFANSHTAEHNVPTILCGPKAAHTPKFPDSVGMTVRSARTAAFDVLSHQILTPTL